jgi:hypothetical protein
MKAVSRVMPFVEVFSNLNGSRNGIVHNSDCDRAIVAI